MFQQRIWQHFVGHMHFSLWNKSSIVAFQINSVWESGKWRTSRHWSSLLPTRLRVVVSSALKSLIPNEIAYSNVCAKVQEVCLIIAIKRIVNINHTWNHLSLRISEMTFLKGNGMRGHVGGCGYLCFICLLCHVCLKLEIIGFWLLGWSLRILFNAIIVLIVIRCCETFPEHFVRTFTMKTWASFKEPKQNWFQNQLHECCIELITINEILLNKMIN